MRDERAAVGRPRPRARIARAQAREPLAGIFAWVPPTATAALDADALSVELPKALQRIFGHMQGGRRATCDLSELTRMRSNSPGSSV